MMRMCKNSSFYQKVTIGVSFMIVVASRSGRFSISALTSPTTTLVNLRFDTRERSKAWNCIAIKRSSIFNRGIQEVSPYRKNTFLTMSLDSRELRFYALSHSSTRVMRALTDDSHVSSGVKSLSKKPMSIDQGKVIDADHESRTSTSRDCFHDGTHSNLIHSLTRPAITIYSHGIAGLWNTFDYELKRAFFYPTGLMSSINYSTSSILLTSLKDSFDMKSNSDLDTNPNNRKNYPIQINLTMEEQELFDLLRTVTKECGMKSTLRVAGGWVRDKILASKEFRKDRMLNEYTSTKDQSCDKSEEDEMNRITSKFKGERKAQKSLSSEELLSEAAPVDIDIALDDKLGREFADELNRWLSDHGRKTHSVGVVLKNPEKSKHLETATMRINNYWIDFVNLRAEEYTSDSRIPDLMRIGTAEEDAFRRDLTINSLFYNINKGIVEDMTGRGIEDLRKGVVATPLPPLTTLLDDPLRVLRSIRFAARLRFDMVDSLKEAAADSRVKIALEQKVSRERIGSEVDLMFKSRDPVGAMRLLINVGLIETVFPLPTKNTKPSKVLETEAFHGVFDKGLALLATTHDYLSDCIANPPLWCEVKRALESGAVNGVGMEETRVLIDDEDARRLLWYAAFLKPTYDLSIGNDDESELKNKTKPRKAKRSFIMKLLVDELKRPIRDAEAVEKIMRAADGFSKLVSIGSDISAFSVVLSDARVIQTSSEFIEGESGYGIVCSMNNRAVDSNTENDPLWSHCMEFRLNCSEVLRRIGSLWRAAFILSLSEQLISVGENNVDHFVKSNMVQQTKEEVLHDILHNYDTFAAAMIQLGLIGIWNQQPIINGEDIKNSILPNISSGPIFRDVMDEQTRWMISHPGGSRIKLAEHLKSVFPEYAGPLSSDNDNFLL